MVFLVLAALAVRFTVAPPSGVVGTIVSHRVSHDRLTSDTGETVQLDEIQHGALIVLGYTRCTDACPLAIAKVVAAARPLRRDVRPRLFFITVDPAYDTPPVLHRYLAAWHNDVVGLTGEPSVLSRVSASFGAGGASRATRDHDTRLFLIDRAGELLSDIPPDISVTDLRRLLRISAVPASARAR